MKFDTEDPTLKSVNLAVTGMTCAGCARTVERVMSKVPGVTSAAVDFELGIAIVNGTVETSSLIAAVEAAGYGASIAEESANRRRE